MNLPAPRRPGQGRSQLPDLTHVAARGARPGSWNSPPSHFAVLADYFAAFVSLTEAERELLRDLVAASRYHPPRRDLWAVGTPAPPPRMLVSGWACRYRQLADGRRQIVCFVLPGDFVGPVLQPRLPSSCAVAAITEVETASAKPLADAAEAIDSAYPGLAHVARMTGQLQESLLSDQIVRLGQQSASARFAHLMLDLGSRLYRLGLAETNRFALPLTQEVLADALGLSVVHLNRTLQQLRRDGLITWKNGVIAFPQPDQIRALADWSPPSRLTALASSSL